MQIGKCVIENGGSPFIIAEIGVNHDGSVGRALELVSAAAEAGADAIKLQYFQAERLLSRAARLAEYQRGRGARDAADLLRRLQLDASAMLQVLDRAHSAGLAALVTMFSLDDVPEMCELPWDGFKTASPDIINRPLLTAISNLNKPMIVSTGAATEEEIARAASWLCDCDVAFLQCVSAYPAPEPMASLGGIRRLAQLTGAPTGYSDHTTALDTGAMAVCAGALVLERHLTYDTQATGPDHACSLGPQQFATYVRAARRAHRMMGEDAKRPLKVEDDVRLASRQSIVAARALRGGRVIERVDLTVKRPGTGIEPWRFDEIVGLETSRAIEADMPLTEADLAAVWSSR